MENFDYTLWEEHVNCFTLGSIKNLFNKHNLSIYHHEKTLFSGRAITVYAKKNKKKTTIVNNKSELEAIISYKNNFLYIKNSLHKHLDKFNNISIYGCGSRSSVFANIMELNINFFIDDQLEKQNKYVPGCRLKIEKWNDDFKDYFMLLGVMYENENKVILKRQLNDNYFSILPPSSNLPNFWTKII